MSALDRKLLRDLKGALGMLLGITSIIAVGVTCYVGLASAYVNLAEAKRHYYAQCRMADFTIEVKKVPVAELAPLAQLPGVAEVRPRIQFYAAVDLPGVEEPLNGLVLSLPDQRRPILNDVLLRQGSYFSDRRQNEVLVSEAFARQHRLEPGQWVHLVMNNRRQELLVVGTALSSEFVYMMGPGTITPDAEHFGVFYVKQSFAEDAFGFGGAANQVVGRLDPAQPGGVREVLRRAEQVLSAYGVFSTTPLEDQFSNRFLTNELSGLRVFAVVAPAMFLGAAALVLNVLLSRLARQQRTVIGTLKAVGYSDGQLFWHLQKFALSVGVAGGLLGCALGWWMAGGMTGIYRLFFQFPRLENHFLPSIHLAGLAISIACAVLGSLRGCRAVLRLRPAEAMRPAAPPQGKAVLLERMGWFWGSLSSGWRMVLRNVFRNRLRTAAGVFAAAMGASVVINARMMSDATDYFVDFQFRWVMRSDMDLTFQDERGEGALLEAARLPGVDRAEPLLRVVCTFRHGPYVKKGTITGLVPGAQLTVPRDQAERPIRVPAAGLAMSRTLAEILHLKRGDWVTIEPIKGLRRPVQAQILEIAEGYFGISVYADLDYLSRLVNEDCAVSGVQLALDRNAGRRAALYRQLKQMPTLQGVAARADIVGGLEETVLKHQRQVIHIMILFAGVVFFGSILNASLVSLAERQRELATLRVLGYGPWHIGSLLLREGLIVTLTGTVLGMPLGYYLTVGIAWAYNTELFRLPIVAGASTWMEALALALAFGLAAHVFVQWAVHRMAWLDALKAQE